MNRVTEKHLQNIVDRLNRITGMPAAPYIDGKAQIGNYHLSHAYGGVCLHRMVGEGGGVSNPLSTGHIPKRELQGLLYAFISGIESRETA
tara:strand:+ start:246 stop:515 length:270 start_codon:yes stop_codon:yes gene_type:complete